MMKPVEMKKMIINLLAVLLFLAPGSAIDTDGSNLKFYSKETAYKKFVLNDKLDFAGASARCDRRGEGWRAVIINSQSEYDFIQEKEKELSDHHPFWIGGSTDVDEDSFLTLRQYINASTDNLSYQSESSWYQKLVLRREMDKSFWTGQCSDIGEGWAPAVINSREELEFIRTQQLGLSNPRSYWIGGSTNQATGDIPFTSYSADFFLGSRAVYVSTFRNGGYDKNNFWLIAGLESVRLFGVLCEKAKP